MEKKTKISVRNLNLYYGQNHALKDVSMDIREKCVTAFIGPSGCGKSTFLRTLNRMNDLVENVRITGEVKLDNEDIYGENVDTTVLRKKIGDHAADISEMTIMMKKISYPKQLEDLKKMASETVLMLIRSIEAYVEKDMEKAQKVIASDDVVDDLFDRNKNDIIEMIHKDPAQGEQAVDLLMVAKYFERIGDHATNIAEWVIFALDDKKVTAGEK